MRLVNLDVDFVGSNQRCHLGPLSPGLNAIHGHRGSGKSTLLHWLRVIAEENRAKDSYHFDDERAHHPAPLAGIAEIENRSHHYRVTTDRNGKIRFDLAQDAFGSYQRDYSQRWDGRVEGHVQGSNLTAAQREAFVGLANANGRYDTVAALEQLAQRLGLDSGQEYGYSNRDPRSTRDQLLARKSQIEQQLTTLGQLLHTREQLAGRQSRLEMELQACRGQGQTLRYEGQDVEKYRLQNRQSVLESDLSNSLREIEALDQEIANREKELRLLDSETSTVVVGDSYRAQLQKLDDRLDRWRQTLRDLKSHRETIEHNAVDSRLDEQVGDQLSSTKDPDPRAAMRSLEAQIQSTRQQLDLLVDRYTTVPGYDYRSASAAVAGTGFRPNEVPESHGVYRDVAGHTYVGHPGYLPESSALPETLRSMQKDLHEVCQQLSRQEARAASETLRQQSMQLKRCETELLEAVEQLIDERATLLRTIANDHHLSIEQLTLAFGKWCQCHDHPHLKEWLLSEESNRPTAKAGNDPALRQSLLDELENLKTQRRDASVRSDRCRQQLRDADVHRRGITATKSDAIGRTEVAIQSDLQEIARELQRVTDRDRLNAELEEVHQELRRSPTEPVSVSHFRDRVNQIILGLMGPHQEPIPGIQNHANRQTYDLVDGFRAPVSASGRRGVPAEITRLAMRLAITESMTSRNEPICLIVDDALEQVPATIQESAVRYLASIAGQQQIVLLSKDPHVVELVRNQGGWVASLGQRTTRTEQPDPNQHLMALANDEEADKWYQPPVPPPTHRGARGEYYLHEASLVEDLPAIDPDVAARCRSLRVDRIGDLLDVDPLWLADQLRIEGVSRSTVETWQSVANLLCNVRKLRPFDARVIVGAGVRTPRELAAMHPSQLLDRVERFLATDRGRKILRSGNSYELSRITTWIASAKGRHEDSSGHEVYDDRYDNFGYERHSRPTRSDGDRWASRSRNGRSRQSYPVIDRQGARQTSSSWRNGNRYEEDREYEGSRRSRSRRSERNTEKSQRSERTSRNSRRNGQSHSATSDTSHSNEETYKFYLELSSPIVDAPSIGPRMAEKLESCGIETVAEFLDANPESLAEQLDNRRVDSDTILVWQQQAILVCRIPNLRGHDAQLLVACDMTSPEVVANGDAEEVLSAVTEVAESKEGQRILRGGKQPDLAEVVDWISWANASRSLRAA